MRCANSNSLPTLSSHAKSVQKKLKKKIKIKIYLWGKNIQKKKKKLIHCVSISFHSYIILLSETSHSQNRKQNLPFHRLTDSLTLSLPFSLPFSLSLSLESPSLSSAIANAVTVSASLTASDEHSSPAIPAATISRVFHSFAVASLPIWLHGADVEQIKPRPMRTWPSAISFSLRLKVSPLGLQKYVFLNPNSFTLFSFESSWIVLLMWCLIRLSFEYLNYVL